MSQRLPSEPLRRLLSLLPGAREGPSGWTARCPAHDDQHASLGVTQRADGAALLHCFAGCEPAAVLTALGLAMKDLFPSAPPRPMWERGRG